MKTILLTKGKVALVDNADYAWLNQHKWYALQPNPPNGTFYATRAKPKNGRYYMHSVILEISGVDHRDGNGLNNARSNLHPATKQQNGANRRMQRSKFGKGFKGVLQISPACWCAHIKFHGQRKYVGYFQSPIEAAHAYDAEAVKLFGEFALTNQRMGLL